VRFKGSEKYYLKAQQNNNKKGSTHQVAERKGMKME
jgi:hypothetical protein